MCDGIYCALLAKVLWPLIYFNDNYKCLCIFLWLLRCIAQRRDKISSNFLNVVL